MSIWSLCTRPILLGCKHTCFCEKSDSPFVWTSFERWSSESRIGCTYSPLHRTFHTSPPPYTSSVRHKTMGVCWQFSNTHLLHHWSPLPPSVLPTIKGRISRPQVLPCLIVFNRICRKLPVLLKICPETKVFIPHVFRRPKHLCPPAMCQMSSSV